MTRRPLGALVLGFQPPAVRNVNRCSLVKGRTPGPTPRPASPSRHRRTGDRLRFRAGSTVTRHKAHTSHAYSTATPPEAECGWARSRAAGAAITIALAGPRWPSQCGLITKRHSTPNRAISQSGRLRLPARLAHLSPTGPFGRGHARRRYSRKAWVLPCRTVLHRLVGATDRCEPAWSGMPTILGMFASRRWPPA